MSAITTHVLDTARGRPAADVAIRLDRRSDDGTYAEVGAGRTDGDGRLRTLMKEATLTVGVYRITFDTGAYFAGLGTLAFYPEASVVFTVASTAEHYHVPLLLNPYGYSTYRGS